MHIIWFSAGLVHALATEGTRSGLANPVSTPRYSTNGLSTMAASALSYGLGKIPSEHLESWQMWVQSRSSLCVSG